MAGTVRGALPPKWLQAGRQLRSLPIALLLTACATAPLPPTSLPQQPAEPQQSQQSQQPAVPPPTSAEANALRALVAQQDRLYRVAAPLLVSNPQLCRNQARNLLGFTAKNKYSYSSEYIDAAQKLFGMGEPLKVTGVLAGSGAARAGLQRGDELLAVEDKPMPQGTNAERQAASIIGPLLTGRTSVRLTILRNDSSTAIDVPLTPACAFGIELGNADIVNTYGDGYRVLVTRGMMNFVRSDNELAYVMAKEMAHNALAHANRQRMSATIGGIIDNLIRIEPDMSTMVGMAGVRPMPPELDAAADRLSLYMLARAGYDIDGAAGFWQRLAAQYPATALTGYTALHPALPFRLQAMDRSLREVKAKQAAKKPLVP
jgi:hypothetical protein